MGIHQSCLLNGRKKRHHRILGCSLGSLGHLWGWVFYCPRGCFQNLAPSEFDRMSSLQRGSGQPILVLGYLDYPNMPHWLWWEHACFWKRMEPHTLEQWPFSTQWLSIGCVVLGVLYHVVPSFMGIYPLDPLAIWPRLAILTNHQRLGREIASWVESPWEPAPRIFLNLRIAAS